MDKDDQEWLSANIAEVQNPEEDFELEVFFSTDGKHTVKVKTDKAITRPKALAYGKKLFEKILEIYGKKTYTPSTSTTKPEAEDLGKCPRCGAANKRSMKGKVYCSDKCWLKP